MSEQEKMTLEVASAEFTSTSKGGWKRWAITTPDGNVHRVLLQSEVNYEPKTGDTLTFFKGNYNSWVLDRDCVGEEVPTNGSPANSTTTTRRSYSKDQFYKDKEKYWEQKDQRDIEQVEYTKSEVNPKIEFQTYMAHIFGMYSNALPNLTNPPKTTEELDAYIDDAYAKVEAIYARRQKAFTKETESTEE